MTFDLQTAVSDHAALFNAAVRAGDYTAFLATFAPECDMRFTNLPVGPFHGRPAIAAAYAAQPPTDTLTVRSIDEVGPAVARVAVAYDGGGSGTMTVCWRDGLVADLEISFD